MYKAMFILDTLHYFLMTSFHGADYMKEVGYEIFRITLLHNLNKDLDEKDKISSNKRSFALPATPNYNYYGENSN
jgi:hypothetical protein